MSDLSKFILAKTIGVNLTAMISDMLDMARGLDAIADAVDEDELEETLNADELRAAAIRLVDVGEAIKIGRAHV